MSVYARPVDPLVGLLDGPRARGAFVLRTVLDPPWALRVLDGSPLTVLAMIRGDAIVMSDAAPPVHLAAGDVALVRGPHHYTVADDAAVHPGQRPTTSGRVPSTPTRCS